MNYTKEQWQVEGTTIYALEHHGWWKGEEQFRNRFSAHVQGYRDTPKGELEANARLMANAPELLEALQELLQAYDFQMASYEEGEAQTKAHAAIAKALGK